VELVEVPILDGMLPDLLEPAVLANETVIINARAVASFAFYAGARKLGAGQLMSGAGADEVLMGNPEALGGVRARVAEDRQLARQVLRDPGDVEERESWDMEHGSLELRYGAWALRELILPPELRGARAHGLTVRTPYLSSRFAELALSLPALLLFREQTG
jgi:asparagine synthase (glutamine-hydrolysing)